METQNIPGSQQAKPQGSNAFNLVVFTVLVWTLGMATGYAWCLIHQGGS